MDWLVKYPMNKRPNIIDIENYLGTSNFLLYKEFTNYLNEKLKLSYIKPKYDKNKGWCLGIGKSGLIMIKEITFCNSMFYVDGIEVTCKEELNRLLLLAEDIYNTDFSKRYNESVLKRRQRIQKKQADKNKIMQHLKIENIINEGKLNKFRWVSPISRNDIKRLYESDAKGLLNTKLLDEVGYGILARCIQAKEERILISNMQVRCHNCGKILSSDKDLYFCECGHQYTFTEYKKSFSENKMPKGNAIPIFDTFIDKWSLAVGNSEKMQLIDRMIHEIHISLNNGMIGRFVGVQLIEGTTDQIKELILNLAYGECAMESIDNKKRFEYFTSKLS